jgi:hypothetical protein
VQKNKFPLVSPILLHVFLLEAFFLATNAQKILFPYFSPEIFVRNKVPSKNIDAGILFLTVIYSEYKGNHVFLDFVARKKRLPVEIRAIK